MERIGVIIVAGGGGSRMGGSIPKQFRLLAGIPILAHTINNFAQALPGARIVVVLPATHTDFWRNFAARFDIAPHTIAEGGEQRFDSVLKGLKALPEEIDLIAVQDGVRPLSSRELILRTVAAASAHGAAIPVVEPVDSFRQTEAETSPAGGTRHAGTENTAQDAEKQATIPCVVKSHIVDRRRLRIVQTPQVFRAELLRQAYEIPYQALFTDDASVVEHAGTAIFLCEGEHGNLKITTPEDLVVAEALIEARKADKDDGEHV